MDFIELILPKNGYYCTAKLVPTGGFAHRFFDDLEEMQRFLTIADRAGHTMYVAQAAFKEVTSRKAVNARALRSFFLDIDCGPNKDYASQKDGAVALLQFCRATGLPQPYLVSSGNGLYAYWVMQEDVPVEKWKSLALVLKGLCAAYSFQVDPVRTADAASVLRPVGSTNRKNGEEKAVRLLDLPSSPISLPIWIKALDVAAKSVEMKSQVFAPPTTFKGVDDEWTSGIEGPSSSLLKIADRCAQIARIRELRGDVSEPTWYNFIGLARFTEEGLEEEIIHEWSQGHADYSFEQTVQKIRHHEESGTGPTTCAKFGADSPSECVACPHANKIKSPIVLGRPELESIAAEEEEEDMPRGFTRTKDGIFFKGIDDIEPIRFYPYDLFVTSMAYDHNLGCEVMQLRHQLPVTNHYEEFPVPSRYLHDPKALMMALSDNHVQVSGKEARGVMTLYLDNYLQKLRAKRNLSTLYTQMGWHTEQDRQVFVLGDSIYRAEETQVVGFASKTPPAVKALRSQGSLARWSAATSVLGLPGMEPMAFAFLAGAFGAPLLHFTGFAGAVVALVGRSGLGKTLVGEWILSTYGDPKELAMQKKDTQNAIFSRLGFYGSLPIYLDEVSNIKADELSELLYSITQGREKARLHRSGVERERINQWNTIAVVSSNHSLGDKLSNLKADASAELNRILEIEAFRVAEFDRELATETHRIFTANSGTAGPEYVKYLVANQDSHRRMLDNITRDLDKKTGATGEERYWSAVCACVLYGGAIAKKLGLIQFDVSAIAAWSVKMIKTLRSEKEDRVSNNLDFFGQMIDDLAGGSFVCNTGRGELVECIHEPRGAATYRINIDKNELIIPRSVVKRYCETHYGSFTEMRRELGLAGAMLDDNARKVLGSGTHLGGTQQPSWVIDLTCPALGRKVVALVRHLESVKKEAV